MNYSFFYHDQSKLIILEMLGVYLVDPSSRSFEFLGEILWEFSKGHGGLYYWGLVIVSSIEMALAIVMIAPEQPMSLH